MREQPDFTSRLSALCSAELSAAHGDADRIGVMIERLVHSVAFAIAVAAGGDSKAMSTLLQGAEAYLTEAAADHAKFGRFMATAKRAAP